MRLVNVIGGLEKHTIPKMSMFIDGVEIGHNQLCNREVEVDEKSINTIVGDIIESWVMNTNDETIDKISNEVAKALSTALSKGQILKVVK